MSERSVDDGCIEDVMLNTGGRNTEGEGEERKDTVSMTITTADRQRLQPK